MNRDLSDLYKTVILQHDRTPFHYEKVENPGVTVQAYNPVCGDQFKLYLTIENEQIKDAYFHGYGCAISKASTSVLIKKIQGLPMNEVLPLLEQFLNLLDSQHATMDSSDEELLAFAAARQFPERLSCATLSWEALREHLHQIQEKA